jgi:signal peptidase II
MPALLELARSCSRRALVRRLRALRGRVGAAAAGRSRGVTPSRWGRLPRLGAIAGIIFVADRLTKAWVRDAFMLGESRPITPFFSLTYVHNTGTAFGLFQGNNTAMLIVACAILVFLLASAPTLAERGGRWGFWGVALVAGGALGNILDRMLYGQVIDFLDFHVWPVFNVADSAISVGAACLLIGSFWGGRR